jgi:Domain of unknown function (DUF4390)
MLEMGNINHARFLGQRRASARRGAWLLCFLATLAAPLAAADTRVEVRGASVTLDEGVYELDARLELSLPDDARRAIDAGLTLRLDYRIEIARVRRYLPDDGVAALVQSYELSYHALSQRYLVRNLNTGEQFDHGSLAAALERVTEVRGLPLIDASLLEPGVDYDFRVRAEITMRTAPDVLSWLLFWTDDWSAASDWYAWTHRH